VYLGRDSQERNLRNRRDSKVKAPLTTKTRGMFSVPITLARKCVQAWARDKRTE
jgi:hypothetical protein